MMRFLFLVPALVLALAVPPAQADPAKCLKTVINSLKKYKKAQLRDTSTCINSRNVGTSSGPCQGNSVGSRTAIARQKAVDKITANCSMGDLATLGYPSDCAYEAATVGREGQCAAMPIASSTDFALCLLCWKQAELAELMATLYASHALDVCAGDLGETSTVCSDLDCTTPLPDQRNLGDTAENDCQRGIAKAGIKYFLSREKVLEKCGLAGGTAASCLGDPKVDAALTKVEAKKSTYIHKKCGNRDPAPSPAFCCRTTGNQCVAAADRDDCETNLGGNVQEDKFCNAGSCDPSPGNKKITWWGYCPESNSCPGTALTTLDDLIACVDTTADAILDELLCIQFPSGWPCPVSPGSASGAFLDVPS